MMFPRHPVHCGHGPVIPPADLEEVRERSKENWVRCGTCNRSFSAICSLHQHLAGGSYHYDHMTMTAFPLDENNCGTQKSCRTPSKYKKRKRDEDEPSEVYYTESGTVVSKMIRYKGKQDSYKMCKVVPGDEEQREKRLITELSKENPELKNPLNVSFEYPTGKAGVDKIPKAIVFEKDVTTICESDEAEDDDVYAQEENESESYEYEEDGQNNEMTAQVQSFHSSVHHLHSENEDQESQTEVSTGMKQEPVTRQMTINVHSLETNEDGSLRIVVGEEDAAVFKTHHGEEILKALKEQAKGIAIKNTQIVYHYTSPDDVNNVDEQSSLSNNQDDSKPGAKKKKQSTKSTSTYRAERKWEKNYTDEVTTSVEGVNPVVFMKRENRITTSEAINLLDECCLGMHDDKISKVQPVCAKGGELYVIDMHALPNRKDTRHDNYLWVHFGVKKYPNKNPRVMKINYKVKLPKNAFSDGFQKIIYEPVNEAERFCIIHYVGYEKVFQPMPHGNRKHGAKIYRRTCPSVLEELKSLTHNDDITPAIIHKQIEASLSPSQGPKNFRIPRNIQQIRNSFTNAKRRKIRDMLKRKQTE